MASNNAALTEKAQDQVHETVDKLAKSAANAEVKLRSVLKDAEIAISENSEKVKERANDSVEKIEAVAKERPLTTIAAAAATGFILARLLRK